MTISVEEAGPALGALIAKTARGEKVVITQNHRPVAELVPVPTPQPSPVFGSCRGMLTILSDDEEHLADFAGYMK